MNQFDYYHRQGETGYLLDCQTELLSRMTTRFVIPLIPFSEFTNPARHLNPVFELAGEAHVLATQFAAAIPAAELQRVAGSLAGGRYTIIRAMDFLLSGV